MNQTQLVSRIRVYGLFVLGMVFLAVGVLNLVDRLHWNDPYDGISWIERDEGVVADRILGEQNQPDIKPGDILLRINQHDIFNMGDYTDVLFMLSPGETARYYLKDRATGDLKSVDMTIQARPVLTVKDFFRMVVAFVYLSIGFLILVKYWRSRGSIHFYLVCLFSFSLYLLSYTNRLHFLDYLVYWMSVASMLVLPPLFLHFSLNFPMRKKWVQNNTLILLYIYIPFLVLLTVQVLWFAGKLAPIGLHRNLSTRIFLDNLHILYFILYFLGALAVLFHSRYSSESTELRQQMKWIVSGTTLSVVPFFFLYVLPFLLNLEITPLMQASILSLAFLPLSFAYAIMKYRLMDVDIIFKRGAAYFIASAAVLGLYFLLIGLSGVILRFFYPGSDTIAIALSALVAAFLFAPIRRRVQQEIDRFFYKEEYKYRQSLIEFGRTLSTESSMRTVTSTIIDRVNKSLNVHTVAIFLSQADEAETYELVAHRGLVGLSEHSGQFKIPGAFLINGLDVPTLSFQIFRQESGSWLGSLREFYDKMGLVYFQPLVHRSETTGVIALGKGSDDELLTSEDLELLGMLSGYAAIALENARLYSTLQNKARELELLKAYSENIIEGINVGVVAINRQGVITTWNQAMGLFYGLDSPEATGRKFDEVFSPDLCATIRGTFEPDTYLATDTAHFYKLFIDSRAGGKKFVNLTVSPFQENDGPVIGTLLVFDDITTKVQLENHLLQAEKLSSLGLMAAGVAHEVNTPLTGISSFTQMLVQEVPETHPHHNMLKKIEAQCFRASEIVNNLLNFARVQTDEFKDVDINRVLVESLNLLEHQFRKKLVQVERRLDTSLPPVWGNEGRLMQVFINILLNSWDAVAPQGRITVGTRWDDNTILVRIEDDGQGIPPEVIQKIYDPFFTTKEIGRGTGLGLSVSYGIIQEHSGRIFVESRPGEGTVFTIKLPVVESAVKEIEQIEQ
jgi:two-component system NtrC family sensor kinase